MPPYAPEVVSGLRQPRTVRMEELATRVPEAAQVPPVATADPSITVYVSKYRRYRVQVTAPSPALDPATGQRQSRKQIVAQFEDGVYRNAHRDPDVRKLIDTALQTNPYFGAFGSTAHYWLASDQTARMEKARIASALDTLKSLPPEVVEAHMAALRLGKAEDHTLPPADTLDGARPARTIRPIA